MVVVKRRKQATPYIYRGGNMCFNQLDSPGLILTRLVQSDFSHLETHSEYVDLVLGASANGQYLRFAKNRFDDFVVILADSRPLDLNKLDEHIVL